MLKRSFLAAALLVAACDGPASEPKNEAAPANSAAPAPAVPAPTGQAEPEADAEAEVLEPATPKSATAAIPEAFHGTWDETPADCEAPSEYRLTVSKDALRFYESGAVPTKVTTMGDDAISVTAEFEAEGEAWTAVRELALIEGGTKLTVTGDGEMTTRIRCTAP